MTVADAIETLRTLDPHATLVVEHVNECIEGTDYVRETELRAVEDTRVTLHAVVLRVAGEKWSR